MTKEYKKYTNQVYDLSIQRTDVPIDLCGGNINVIAATGDCYIKLNDKSQDPINLLHVNNIKGKFEKIYISNQAQVGNYIAFTISKPELELTTNIKRTAYTPIPIPSQNIPQHLKGRVLDRPAIINIWDIGNATFRHSFDTSLQINTLRGIFLSEKGDKLYVADHFAPATAADRGRIYEYDLNRAWDISSTIYRHHLDISTQTTRPVNLFFSPDGKFMYTINGANSNILTYTLTRNWDVTSATFTSSYLPPNRIPFSIFFNPSGHKMYIINTIFNFIYEFDLTVAWDVTTATFRHLLDINPQIVKSNTLHISPDGLITYVIDRIQNKIVVYRLLEAWNIRSAVFKKNFDFSVTLTNAIGLFFKPDGKKMYLGSKNTRHIYEFDL